MLRRLGGLALGVILVLAIVTPVAGASRSAPPTPSIETTVPHAIADISAYWKTEFQK